MWLGFCIDMIWVHLPRVTEWGWATVRCLAPSPWKWSFFLELSLLLWLCPHPGWAFSVSFLPVHAKTPRPVLSLGWIWPTLSGVLQPRVWCPRKLGTSAWEERLPKFLQAVTSQIPFQSYIMLWSLSQRRSKHDPSKKAVTLYAVASVASSSVWPHGL